MSCSDPAGPRPPDSGDAMVCSCLQISKCQLLATLAGGRIQTLRDLRRATGAGDGCTACHAALRGYLAARTRVTHAHADPADGVTPHTAHVPA